MFLKAPVGVAHRFLITPFQRCEVLKISNNVIRFPALLSFLINLP